LALALRARQTSGDVRAVAAILPEPAAMQPGILFTQLRSPAAAAPLDTLALPGSNSTARYRSVEPAVGAALVQYYPAGALPAADTLPGVPGVARYTARQVSDTGPVAEHAPVLMIVAFDVPAERAADVERWYAIEHIELLMRAPGWLRARRYEVVSFAGGERYTSLALHELRSVQVLDSPERAFARRTAWRAVLEAEPWFAAAGRFIYERC
jgi:hypothetical protein